jgi:hypothetical protein
MLTLCFLSGSIADKTYGAGKSRQSCEGIVGVDSDGMLLLKETRDNVSPWCDAYIGEGKDSSLAIEVLAQCPLGTRCAIDGMFAGHGVFYWTKILSAKRK